MAPRPTNRKRRRQKQERRRPCKWSLFMLTLLLTFYPFISTRMQGFRGRAWTRPGCVPEHPQTGQKICWGEKNPGERHSRRQAIPPQQKLHSWRASQTSAVDRRLLQRAWSHSKPHRQATNQPSFCRRWIWPQRRPALQDLERVLLSKVIQLIQVPHSQ